MITKNIREVKILSAEFRDGKMSFIKVSIDSWNPSWGCTMYTVECGKEFSIVPNTIDQGYHGATFEEIELIKEAYARAEKLDFSNYQIPEKNE